MRIVRSLVMAETSSKRGVSPVRWSRLISLCRCRPQHRRHSHTRLGRGHRLDDCERQLTKTSESFPSDAAGTAVATALLSAETAFALGGPKLMVVLTRTHRAVTAF